MKIIQISDPHLVTPGRRLWGLDPSERLRLCLDDVGTQHPDVDLVVVTGDLSDGGLAPAYARLRGLLAGLAVPVRLLLGNHDDRGIFRAAFPEALTDADGFVQSVHDAGSVRLVFLDTLEAGETAGRLGPRRLAWLAARLEETAAERILLFMHHPPMPTGQPGLDSIRLQDAEPFWAVLAPHRARIAHIFCGHQHRPVGGSWRGVPFTVLRGTNHQCALELRASGHVDGTHEPPHYAVILVTAESVVVHLHDFTYDGPRFSLGEADPATWEPRETIE
jgi:3',5'-cyclic AMP phosphodiesterase CpdA